MRLRLSIVFLAAVYAAGCGDGPPRTEMAERSAAKARLVTPTIVTTLETAPEEAVDVSALIEAATDGFAGDNPDSGFAYLTAALAADPSGEAALESLIDEAGRRAGTADPSAGAVITAADAALRTALTACRTPADVDRIVSLSNRLDVIADSIESAEVEDDVASRVRGFLASGVPRNEAAIRTRLLQGDRLFGDVVAASRTTADDRRAAEVAVRLDELRAALELLAVRGLTAKADAAANELLEDVESRVAALWSPSANPVRLDGFQKAGEKLAALERRLAGVSPLASADVQFRGQQVLQALRKEAATVRLAQRRAYNGWAISRVERAAEEFKEASGWVDDDEAKFMATLGDTLGVVEPSELHPAVASLYADVFQKLLGQLSPEDKVLATKRVESMKKRQLADF